MPTVAERIRGLSPLGPIFGKELRATARRKRTYILRFVYLGVLLLVLLVFWATIQLEGHYRNNQSVAIRAQRMAETGAIFFAIYSVFTMCAMGLLGPILTATAINSERLHKTLHVLLMTPITAWQIVSGKLFSRLLIALSLIGLSLPVLAVVRLLGGVEVQDMLGVVSLCISVAIFTASVGLFFSTLMNRAYSVILLTYGFLGFLWALAPLLYGLICFEVLEIRGNRFEQFSLNLAVVAHPGFPLISLINPFFPMGGPHWSWCVLLYLVMSALLILWSAAILRRMARKENEGAGGPVIQTLLPAALVMPPPLPGAAAPANGADPSAPPPLAAQGSVLPYAGIQAQRPGKAGKTREVSDNPVLWREIRRPLMNRLWQKIAATILVLGLLFLFYGILLAENDLHDREVQTVFAVIFCGLLNVLACIVSSTAIAQEKESDTWTLLLAAPLSSTSIVVGKLLGLMRRLAWPIALVIAHFMLFALTGVLRPEAAIASLWIILSSNMLWVASGLYFSLRLPNVTYAIILNLLMPVILYGGVPLVMQILGALLAGADDAGAIFVFYAPYGYLVGLISEMHRRYYNPSGGYYSGYYTADDIRFPWNTRFTQDEFLWLTLVVGLIYLAVAAAIIAWTAWRFDAIVGRASQSDRLPTRATPAAAAGRAR